MNETRIRAGKRVDLGAGQVWAVPLPVDHLKRPREALVLLGHDAEPRAYLNRCRHLPVPIDGGSRAFLTPDGEHLLCGTHGALYRIDDGVCTAGPCPNVALFSLRLEERDGWLYVVVDEPAPRKTARATSTE